MNESDLLAFEQVQVQSALSELQPLIEASQVSGDHDALAQQLAPFRGVQPAMSKSDRARLGAKATNALKRDHAQASPVKAEHFVAELAGDVRQVHPEPFTVPSGGAA